MSFIAGLVFSPAAHAPDAARMLGTGLLARFGATRGADDTGLWTAPGIVMATRLRRTLDLSFDGAQPFHAADRTRTVAFDGYIANAPALRHELEAAGKRFSGHADAELVAEGAAHWGLNRLLQKMEGAFAFALWDAGANALHLVRDRMGARPLYAAQTPAGLAFASDYRAFASLPGFTPALDAEALSACLAWGHTVPPRTMWQGVLSLPPAHRLMLRPDDTALPAPEAYWSPARALEEIALRGQTVEPPTRLDRLSSQLAAEAIRLDVPFALVDDTTPASAQLRMTLHRASETGFQTAFLTAPDGATLQTAFDALALLPEPVTDPAAPAWWAALRRASADAGVALAALPLERAAPDDERTARLRRLALRLPAMLRGLLPATMRALVHNASQAYAARRRLWQLAYTVPETPEPRMDASAAQMLAFHGFCDRFCLGFMPALDRIAASAGIDLRLPLADARLLDFGLPGTADTAPSDIAAWMRGPLRPRIQDLMVPAQLARIGLSDPKPYLKAWTDLLAGDDTPARRLWALVMVLAWAAKN